MNIEFASSLEKTLISIPRPPSLATDLLENIDKLAEHRLVAASNFRDVDEYGTRLWNISSRLKKDEATSTKLVCLGMVSPKLRSSDFTDHRTSACICLFAARLQSQKYNWRYRK